MGERLPSLAAGRWPPPPRARRCVKRTSEGGAQGGLGAASKCVCVRQMVKKKKGVIRAPQSVRGRGARSGGRVGHESYNGFWGRSKARAQMRAAAVVSVVAVVTCVSMIIDVCPRRACQRAAAVHAGSARSGKKSGSGGGWPSMCGGGHTELQKQGLHGRGRAAARARARAQQRRRLIAFF